MHLFIGNLVEAPVLTVTPNTKKPTVRLRIACSESYRDATGQWRSTDAVFWNCFAWDEKATAIASQDWQKGQSVVLAGDFRTSQWEDEGGARHYRTDVVIRAIGANVLRPKREAAQAQAPASVQAQHTPAQPQSGFVAMPPTPEEVAYPFPGVGPVDANYEAGL